MKSLLMEKDIRLLFELGTFRYTHRTRCAFYNKDYANPAEHTFRVAWIALLLAGYENNKNIDTILKMALIHDVQELRSGNTHAVQKPYISRYDQQAIHDQLTSTTMHHLEKIRQQFEEKKTPEAQIVKDADYLDQLLELKEKREIQGYHVPALWDSITTTMHAGLYTASAKKLRDSIIQADVFDRYNPLEKVFTNNQ